MGKLFHFEMTFYSIQVLVLQSDEYDGLYFRWNWVGKK